MADTATSVEPQWVSYAERRPAAAGVYQWRIPSVVCSGLTVTFFAKMRERLAGHSTVLSPSFDYWDGWKVIVPPQTEWRAVDYQRECKTLDYLDVVAEGVEYAPCPFCGERPILKGLRTGYDGRGVVVGTGPHQWNAWWLECCRWAADVRLSDPRKLAEVRNAAISGARASTADPNAKLRYSWPTTGSLAPELWAPDLDDIRRRLRDHAEACGQMGFPPSDMARDADFLLQQVEQLTGQGNEG